MACKKTGQIILQRPIQHVWQQLLQQPTISGYPIVSVQPQINSVFLETGFSMKSYGEYITIRLDSLNENQTRVTVTSEPRLPTVLVDWGENKKNVINILNYVRSIYGLQCVNTI